MHDRISPLRLLMPLVWLTILCSGAEAAGRILDVSHDDLARIGGYRGGGYSEQPGTQSRRPPTIVHYSHSSPAQSEFLYTNRTDQIKVVVDELNSEIRVSRLPGGIYTGKVERYGLDDFDRLINSFVLDGFMLQVISEIDSPEPEAPAPVPPTLETIERDKPATITRTTTPAETHKAPQTLPPTLVQDDRWGNLLPVLVILGLIVLCGAVLLYHEGRAKEDVQVQCQQCNSQMKRTARVERSCALQLFGVAAFFIGLVLLFAFPIGTIVGLFVMLGAARLGYSRKKVWKCTNCGYFFERA